jgi:CheY-like chemotaxis protein
MMTGMREPLRILVMGSDRRLNEVLVRNLCRWGYVASIWESNVEGIPAAPVDLLLVDLDEGEDELSAGEQSSLPGMLARPPARLTVTLGSQALRRKTLESLETALFVPKPFDMGVLRRYLITLERVLRSAASTPSQTPTANAPVRVLVADDDSRLTELACAMLARDGRYLAHAAHDGIEVLEYCLDWAPQCLVMDMMMPRMNGYQVLRCLQARPQAERLPVVVLSALAGVEVSAEALKLPSLAVIKKPLRSTELLAAVERVLGMKRPEGSRGSLQVG